MLLGDLVGCIESLQERIGSHRDTLREYETRTRMALIDPMLRVLGWDVSNPDLVTPEYRAGDGWADYALLRDDGGVAAILEAKKLGEPLSSHRMQMLNYANVSGIEFAGLTDGNHWELYKIFERGQLDERRELDVSIIDAPVHRSALQLMLLWRPNLASGEPVPASAPILGAIRQPPTSNIVEQTDSLRRGSPGWVALSEYDPPPKTPCPIAVRFWDGSEETLKYWHDLLTGVARKLYSEGRLGVEHVPIGWSKGRYSVHTEPVHPTGEAFVSPKSVDGTPFVLNVNLNAGQIRGNTKRLLQHCNLNPGRVYLQVAK